MSSQRGSAIIMLFIAVALFGALAYAFLQGSRSSTGFLTDEQAKVYAQQLIGYANDVKSGTKRLVLRGCKPLGLSWANTVYKSSGGALLNPDGHNPAAPTDGSCDLFKIQGAGLTPFVAPSGALNSAFSGGWQNGSAVLNLHRVLDLGTVTSEITWYMVAIHPDVCKKINDLVGVNNPNNAPPLATTSTFGGSYTGGEPATVLNDTYGSLTGKSIGCYQTSGGTGNYQFYSVLIPR